MNFRYHTTRAARRLSLKGWVANRRDGRVEAVAEGAHPDLEAFEKFLHRGSPSARVEKVDVSWESYTGEFDGFRVRFL